MRGSGVFAYHQEVRGLQSAVELETTARLHAGAWSLRGSGVFAYHPEARAQLGAAARRLEPTGGRPTTAHERLFTDCRQALRAWLDADKENHELNCAMRETAARQELPRWLTACEPAFPAPPARLLAPPFTGCASPTWPGSPGGGAPTTPEPWAVARRSRRSRVLRAQPLLNN